MTVPTPRAKKRFGQNFLHDPSVIDRIVQAIDPKPGQSLVEIGPGPGALTEPVLRQAGRLHVVELDRDLIEPLTARCAGAGELHVNLADALRFDFASLPLEPPLRLLGNLPYNISSPLLFHLLEQPVDIQDMHFMLQWEVVHRMVAPPGSKAYGRLTVMLAYHCQVFGLFKVGPGAFKPPPKVTSAIVRLVPHTTLPEPADDYASFCAVVAAAFGQRRKTLANSLKPLLPASAITAAGVDPGLRPERLDLKQFVRLANAVHAVELSTAG